LAHTVTAVATSTSIRLQSVPPLRVGNSRSNIQLSSSRCYHVPLSLGQRFEPLLKICGISPNTLMPRPTQAWPFPASTRAQPLSGHRLALPRLRNGGARVLGGFPHEGIALPQSRLPAPVHAYVFVTEVWIPSPRSPCGVNYLPGAAPRSGFPETPALQWLAKMLEPLKHRRRCFTICVVEEIEQAVRLMAGSVSVCLHKRYHRESLRIELEIERQ
jgi:hypothetical protein